MSRRQEPPVVERCVEVFVPGSRRFGSGYCISESLVLTAGHVVEDASGGSCEVRPLGERNWSGAQLVWHGEGCDAALLELDERDRRAPLPFVRLGRPARSKRSEATGLGFPAAQEKKLAGRDVRDTEKMVGTIEPDSDLKEGLLAFHLAGSVPLADRKGGSPWQGCSGAAVFCGPLLVGIVCVDPASFGTDRLKLVPVTAMAAEPAFVALLRAEPDGVLYLEAVENLAARDLLGPPYRALPRKPAPSILVHPAYGVVPFRGRTKEMSELERWASTEGWVELALVHARGGVGKTRLAAELCRRLEREGWLAGFLVAQASSNSLLPLAAAVGDVLVVIDDAETQPEQLEALLELLVAQSQAERIRVLLLARGAGDWWRRLPQRLRSPEAEALFDNPTMVPLGPAEPTEDRRQAAFREAAEAFAPVLRAEPAGQPEPDFTAPVFDSLLFLHLAALSALEWDAREAPRSLGEELLEAALRREARYWQDTWRAWRLEPDDDVVRERVVGLATLTTASNEIEAAKMLSIIPDLAEERQERLRVARWLRELYPGSGCFNPLEPDPIGEALVARVLGDDPELSTRLLALAEPGQSIRCLTVLTRAARDHDSADRALRDALTGQPAPLLTLAIEVAQQTGDPLGVILAEVLERTAKPELAAKLFGHLPAQTVALREVAEVVVRQAHELILKQPPSLERDALLAESWVQRSRRLAALGKMEEARAASEEAVAMSRRLADLDPEQFEPELADALEGLAGRLMHLGEGEAALAVMEDAVDLYRHLVATRPDAFLPPLATALGNLSTSFRRLNRPAEALAAIDESVVLYRQLAATSTDSLDRQELAHALSNRSEALTARGQHQAALKDIEEAVAIERDLVEADRDAFLPDLAIMVSDLADRLATLGRAEDALDAVAEAVAYFRRLAAARPNVFLKDLAVSLDRLSDALGELGRHEEALATMEEVVAIRRRLAEVRPGAFLDDLAGSLNNLGALLARLGRHEEAAAAIADAVAIFRQLVDVGFHPFPPARLERLQQYEEPSEALHAGLTAFQGQLQTRQAILGKLAMALTNLSGLYAELGRHEQAVAAAGEAVTVFRELAGINPTFVDDLAWSLARLTHRYDEAGQHGRGEATWAEVLDEWRRYPAAYPFLLVARARTRSDVAAFVADLVEALNSTEGYVQVFGDLVLQARSLARRRRSDGPGEFDRHWRDLTGELPAWLEIDQTVADQVTSWFSTQTWEESASYLEEHRAELLRPDAEAALDELALVADPAIVDAHRNLLTAARERDL
jgi:tetratricopeptide (TPR) repeat protein